MEPKSPPPASTSVPSGRRKSRKQNTPFAVQEKWRGEVPGRSNGREDKVYERYLETLNPRENERVQLALARTADPKFRAFLRMVLSNRRYTLPSMAKYCGITLDEFCGWMQNAAKVATLGNAQLLALDIVEDMGVDARSKMIACSRCDGLGWVGAEDGLPADTPGYRVLKFMETTKIVDGVETREEVPVWIRECPMGCDHGRIRITGDQHSRDRVLEVADLIGKKGGGTSITLNLGGASHPSAVGLLNAIKVEPED